MSRPSLDRISSPSWRCSGLFFMLALLLAPVAGAWAQVAARAPQIQSPVWVDLGDIMKYRPDLMPDAAVIVKAVTSNPSVYTPNGEEFIGGIELQQYGYVVQPGFVTYPSVTALMYGSDGSYFYRVFSITVSGRPRAVSAVRVVRDIPLSQMSFSVNVGLVQRAVVLNDAADDVTLLFPLGVGGVDPGVIHPGKVTMLTPLFHNAKLKRSTVISQRSDPTYFREQPFMPITSASGITTAVAFHVTILSDDDWQNKGPNYLVRGFDSHGCMRLREKDLNEFYTIVMQGSSEALPVNVAYFVDFENTLRGPVFMGSNYNTTQATEAAYQPLRELHPYPLTNQYYQAVKNAALPGEPPVAERDPVEHLLVLQVVPGIPDFQNLASINGDELSSLTEFSSQTEDLPLRR